MRQLEQRRDLVATEETDTSTALGVTGRGPPPL